MSNTENSVFVRFIQALLGSSDITQITNWQQVTVETLKVVLRIWLYYQLPKIIISFLYGNSLWPATNFT